MLSNISYNAVLDNILRINLLNPDIAASRSKIIDAKYLQGNADVVNDFLIEKNNHDISIYYKHNKICQIQSIDLEQINVYKQSIDGSTAILETVKTVDGERTRIKNLKSTFSRKAFRANLYFKLLGKALYGLGQDEEGIYNKRNHLEYLYQHNMKIPMPVILSSDGYGILFDCASLMVFDDRDKSTKITLDTVDYIDFYIIVGSFDDIVQGIRKLTGKATLLPKWAFGYIQSKEKYNDTKELVEVANEYRKRNIPLDVIVQDWKTWTGDLWGEKVLDKQRFPNPTQLNQTLHDLNVHTMISIWPNMAAGGTNHSEFAKKNLLLMDYSTYDAFSEEARKVFWDQIEREMFSKGFDSWWCDSTEPFPSADWCGEKLLPEETRYKLVGRDHKKYLDAAYANFYSVVHAQGIYENQVKAAPQKRILNLTRSGYVGIQRYSVVLWAGDTSAKWSELRKEIAKGVNISLCGIPYWTVDIGAFFVGSLEARRKWCNDPQADPVWFWNGDYPEGVDNMGYRELYVRWMQFGCFLPIFRSHGTDTPREIWNFGKSGEMFYDSIEKFINLRYQLLPYLYSCAGDVTFNNGTIMRSLMFDFSDDSEVLNISDEFMFGQNLLICPVYEPMYFDEYGQEINKLKIKNCYLPKGNKWFSFWTDEAFDGGEYININADIETIPVFVKGGSIIIMQGKVSHALENQSKFDIKLYPSGKQNFVFYNDDGISNNYLKGISDIIEMSWDSKTKIFIMNPLSRMKDVQLFFDISFENNRKSTILKNTKIIIDFN